MPRAAHAVVTSVNDGSGNSSLQRTSRLGGMATYDGVRALPLHIDGYYLEPLEREVARGFTLRRTVVVLHGRGEEGRGEEVDYDPAAQATFQADDGKLPFAGEHTVESFSLLQSGQTEYRRWAFESAALDLALRQAGVSLGEAVGREAKPLRFVVSTRVANVAAFQALYPSLRFKLDPGAEWTDEIVDRLAESGRVDTADFKGVYRGAFGAPPDPRLYRRIADAFPNAWLEDPALTLETSEVLASHRDRITWDAGIHEWSDVEALPFTPRCLNSKPSRFGSVKRLFDFYDGCEREGIALYGGGQFELGPGRGQIQLLASLFHPDAPNDVAPDGFNVTEPSAGLPESPLVLEPRVGFSL